MKSGRKLRLTADARADIRSILRYTARQWGIRQRDIYHAALLEGMDKLLRHPALGEERTDLFDGCRALRVEHHLLFYRIAETGIVVGRVLHVRQMATGIVVPF
jgi:toxin ParE1/3/4